MSKLKVSKLFLYRYRFFIGYSVISFVFFGIIFLLPLFSPNGLNSLEISSATTSMNTNLKSIINGNIIDLPYHILQRLIIQTFGLSVYTVKIPSIIIAALSGILLILLLSRWFKNNVAIMSSLLAVLSSVFLFVSGFGTPLIMVIFWPILLLWLGSKIQGRFKPVYCFVFAFTLLIALFTPYMPYLVIFILIYVLFNPHLRFTVFSLPKIPLIASTIIILAGTGVLTFILFKNNLLTSLFIQDFSISNFLGNLKSSIQPFLSWHQTIDNIMLSPLINLATLTLALIGLISTAKGFFASRNSIATLLIVYTLFISGFNPHMAVLWILPITILVAHGIRHILSRWYSIFPENPYARVFVFLPISIFIGVIAFSDLTHYMNSYYYNPSVANHFSIDLTLIKTHLDLDTTLVIKDNESMLKFYQIAKKDFKTTDSIPSTPNSKVASVGKLEADNLELRQIITSPKTSNSDRIYIYIVK